MKTNYEISATCAFQTVLGKSRVVIDIRGLTVGAFKNRKRAIVRNGSPRTLTDPKAAKRMELLRNAIKSALLSGFQTASAEILTAARLRSLIALLPSDDNWMIIPEQSQTGTLVERGQEGVTITIEEL